MLPGQHLEAVQVGAVMDHCENSALSDGERAVNRIFQNFVQWTSDARMVAVRIFFDKTLGNVRGVVSA